MSKDKSNSLEAQKNGGDYFIIPRSIFESAIWHEDLYVLKIFLWLIGNAHAQPKKYPGFEVKRGELVTSLSHIAEENKYMRRGRLKEIPKTRVFRILHKLEEEGYITINCYAYGTHIKICNYEAYQSSISYNWNANETQLKQEMKRKNGGNNSVENQQFTQYLFQSNETQLERDWNANETALLRQNTQDNTIENQELKQQQSQTIVTREQNDEEEVPHIYNIYNNNTNKLNSTISTNDLNKTKVLFVDTFPATDKKTTNSPITNQPENPTDSPPVKDDLLELLAEKRKKKLKKAKKPKEKPDPNIKLIHDYFRQRYKEVHEVEYMVQGYAMERKIIKGWLKMYKGDVETIKGIINEFLTDFRFRDDPYWKGDYSIRALQANWNKFAAQWKYLN